MAECNSPTDTDKEANRANEIRDEIADYVIDVLRILDKEYDSMVKNAEERCDASRYKQTNFKERQIHDVVEEGISMSDDMKRRWEEKELSNKILDIQEAVRVSKIERQTYVEKKTLMERRLMIEQMKIGSLNEQIQDSVRIASNLESTEEQLKSIMDDFEHLSVVENIYPTALLEMHSAYNQMQTRIQEMEKELLKYADLPPDYGKAREKLTEAMLHDKELEKRIRNVIT